MFKLRSICLSVTLAAAALGSATASAANRNVEIANKSGFTMVAFYASRANVTDWEENILAGQKLKSGSSIVIDIDDGTKGCVYDFKAVFSDGDEVVSEDNNVCELELFTFE
ncbi:MAG: hypothetical protein AB7E59_06115 [Pusillimonas sp.]